jgi:RNA polymerase sigma factor for flagellar operon FliA
VRRWEREITKVRERFVLEHRRQPTRAELGDLVGLEPEVLERHLADIQRAELGSLNAPVGSDETSTLDRVDLLTSEDSDFDPESQALKGDLRERFREAFAQLSPREQQVAVRLYVDNLTLREIGETLGVTESRVCQIHGQLRRRLQTLLAD